MSSNSNDVLKATSVRAPELTALVVLVSVFLGCQLYVARLAVDAIIANTEALTTLRVALGK